MVWSIVAVIGAASVGLLAWMTALNPANSVHAEATGFDLTDEHSVTVRFQLTAPAGTVTACAIEALDEEFGVVGWRVVEFEASDAPIRPFTETVPTVAAATTGLVNACWLP